MTVAPQALTSDVSTLDGLPEVLLKKLPKNRREELQKLFNDPSLQEIYREGLLSYIGVLTGSNNWSAMDYARAVKYVTHRMMGDSKLTAWIKTFPDRHKKAVEYGSSDRVIEQYANIYNRGKLVTAIIEQTLVPVWIANQSVYQKAINVQAELMVSAKSEMVRMQAANSVLTHLAKPKDTIGAIVNVEVKESEAMVALRESMNELAHKQKALIKRGVATKTVIEGTSCVVKQEVTDE